MLVGITGADHSGRKTAVAYFAEQGFEVIEYNQQLIDEIVSRWRENFVVLIPETPGEVAKRPWFVHLNIERQGCDSNDWVSRVDNIRNAHINIVNNCPTIAEFHQQLAEVNVLDTERIRPSWDRYFMKMADLAASRSNCMKRRVGCVLVSENRVVATGYNGTPRGTQNCNEGGCPRCNSASRGGTMLNTCLCLHAEENALLEAGRQRSKGAILYCNTCPCLTCSIKIVQTNVQEVVYSQDYSMDTHSAEVLKNGGVLLRKYKY